MAEKSILVNSTLQTKATAALNEEIQHELKVEDPSEAKAAAILKGEDNETKDC